MNRRQLVEAMVTIFLFAIYWLVTLAFGWVAIFTLIRHFSPDDYVGGIAALGFSYTISWVVANLYIIDYWIEHETE